MFNIREIAKILDGQLINYKDNFTVTGISTDSRDKLEGKLFIPLIGEKFNGHDFIKQAVAKGAFAALTSEDKNFGENITLIKVTDTLEALGKIAKYYITKNRFKVIAITGSAGKTTTKDILKHVTGFYGTEKNYNNLIGVPLTILNADKNENFIILELGINTPGEMEKLNNITTPEYVIITNIGYGHLEGFGSLTNVFKEKSLLIKNNPDLVKGFIHENIDIRGNNIFTFGESEEVHCKLLASHSDCIKNSIRFSYKNKEYQINTKLLGKFNAFNIISVFMTALELGFDDEFILKRIESFTPSDKRSVMLKTDKSYYIFNDCYNANFDSFRGAIDLVNELNVFGKKIAVIGDMFELGKFSKELHSKLGEIISESDIKYIVGTGELIKNTLRNINKHHKLVKYFHNKDEIVNFINSNAKSGDLLLIKASRGMKFEEITEKILKYA
jgi:UDP-N-acetylmuramoyl-tripeptide--D-alanyl-D-alanine ligase